MATDLTIDAGGVAALASRFAGGPALLQAECKTAMQRSVLEVQRGAMEAAPVDTGTLRRSITAVAESFEGTVGTNLPYAQVVEFGRSAGAAMPPQGALLGWMGRKGIDASAEYVVRRAIALRGIAGKLFMTKTLAALEPQIRREFELALARVVAKLGGR